MTSASPSKPALGTPGPKPNRPLEYQHPTQHYADLYRATRQTVNRWMREAAPLDDPSQFCTWLCCRKSVTLAIIEAVTASASAQRQQSNLRTPR